MYKRQKLLGDKMLAETVKFCLNDAVSDSS